MNFTDNNGYEDKQSMAELITTSMPILAHLAENLGPRGLGLIAFTFATVSILSSSPIIVAPAAGASIVAASVAFWKAATEDENKLPDFKNYFVN